MEIVEYICEIDGCVEEPYREVLLGETTKLLCYQHNNCCGSGEAPRRLSLNDRESLVRSLQITKNKLNTARSKLMNISEELTVHIVKSCTEKINKFIKLEQKITRLQSKIQQKSMIFPKILEHLDKSSALTINSSAFEIQNIFDFISDIFDQSFLQIPAKRMPIRSASLPPYAQPSEPSFISPVSGFKDTLINQRLLSKSTPLWSKLKLLSKTSILTSLDLKFNDPKHLPESPQLLFQSLRSPTHLLISHKKNFLFTGHQDSHILIWDASGLTHPLHDIFSTRPAPTAHSENYSKLTELFLSSNEQMLIIVGYTYIEKFNVASMSVSSTYTHENGSMYICKPFLNDTMLVMGNYDGELWIFDLTRFSFTKRYQVLKGSAKDPVTCISNSLSCNFMVVGDRHGKINLWNTDEKHLTIISIAAYSSPVTIVAFSNDTKFLVSVSQELTMKVWNCFDKFRLAFRLSLGVKNPTQVVFLRTGVMFLVLGDKNAEGFQIGQKLTSFGVKGSQSLVYQWFF